MGKERLLSAQELAEAVKPIDPPSQATPKPSSSSTGSGRAKSKKGDTDLIAGMTSTVELLGVGVSFLDDYDGDLIHEKAHIIAEAFVELSHHNPRVRRLLEQLVTGSAWGGVVVVLGTEVALPIAIHHGLLPEPINTVMAEARDIPVRANKGDKEKVVSLVDTPDGNENTEQPR